MAAQKVTSKRRTPCGSNAASISFAVFPVTGCRSSGAISARGSSTKRRSAMRGMRHLQLRRGNYGASIEQYIDIDIARTLRSNAAAAHVALDLSDARQQLQWKQAGLHFHHRVQEPRLIEHIARRGLIQGRPAREANIVFLQPLQSFAQIGFAIP